MPTRVLTALLFLSAAASAATPEKLPPPLIQAVWSGAPEGFETTAFHSEWRWHEELQELGPNAEIEIEGSIRVPDDWQYKAVRPRATRVIAVKRLEPGLWSIKAEQDVMEGGAAFDFLDLKGQNHVLSVVLRTHNRTPYVLKSKTCSDIGMKLDERANTARFLFIALSCSTFGETATFVFRRSPDARWVAAPEIKSTKAMEFEYKFPIEPTEPPTPEGRKLFNLRTEDAAGRRSEWVVFATEK